MYKYYWKFCTKRNLASYPAIHYRVLFVLQPTLFSVCFKYLSVVRKNHVITDLEGKQLHKIKRKIVQSPHFHFWARKADTL